MKTQILSQNDKVWRHLKSGRSITQALATARYKIYCLPERIRDLREKYGRSKIITDMVRRNRSRFARYSMK